MKFKKEKHITNAVDSVWRELTKLNRGDLITHRQIIACTGFDPEHRSYETIMKNARAKLLKEREIAMRSIPGVGYRLLETTEQVIRCAEDRQRRMGREAHRAIKEVAAVDGSSLSDHNRQVQNVQLKRLRESRKQMRSNSRELRNVHKTDTIPMRRLATE